MRRVLACAALAGLFGLGCAGPRQTEVKRPPENLAPAVGDGTGSAPATDSPAPAPARHVSTVVAGACAAGTICGTVIDAKGHQAVIGATLVAAGPALEGSAAEITDEHGRYEMRNLPPGEYTVTLYYADIAVVQAGVQATGRVDWAIDMSAAGGEVIEIRGAP